MHPTIRKRLNHLIRIHGNPNATAVILGIDRAYFHCIIKETKQPSNNFLAKIGIEIIYKIKPNFDVS